MPSVEVTVDTSDLEAELQRRFGDKVKNLPMHTYSGLLIGAVDEMFETSGAAGSEGEWEPLSMATLQRRPNRAGGQLLIDSGAMAAVQVFSVDADSVTIGSQTAYSGFHVDGTQNMARRDFFALNFPKVLDELADMMLQDFG